VTRPALARQDGHGLTPLRAYLSAEQLSEVTPWTPDGIEKMMRRGVLMRGVHYFQPFGRRSRLVFKWDAIVALIEGRAVQSEPQAVVEGETVEPSAVAPARRTLDVEKATTDLQRLLG
jgi:hypothetical protein